MKNRIGKLERIWEGRDREERRTKHSDERLKGERERDRKRGQRDAEEIRNRIRRRKNEENGGGGEMGEKDGPSESEKHGGKKEGIEDEEKLEG